MEKVKEAYSPKELREITGKSLTHVYNLFHSKGFPAYKLRGSLMVDKADYEAWKKEQKAKGVH